MSHTQSTYLLSRAEAGAVSGRPCTDTTVCPWPREACRQDTFRSRDKAGKTAVRFGICQNPRALSPHGETTRGPAPRGRGRPGAAVPGAGARRAVAALLGTRPVGLWPCCRARLPAGTTSLSTLPAHGRSGKADFVP